MKRVLRLRWFLPIILFLVNTWWIYSKLMRYTSEDVITKKISNLEFRSRRQEHHRIHNRINIQEETNSNDKNIEGDENYPQIIVHVQKKSISNDNDIEETENSQLIISHVEEERISSDNGIEDVEAYPLIISHIPQPIVKKLKNDLYRSFESDEKSMEELKKMLDGPSTDIEFEEDFLRLYVTSNNYEIETAYFKIQNLLNLRINHNYLFNNINFDFTRDPAYKFVTLLPHRRKDGSVTLLFELAKWDPEKVPFEHLKQILFMIYMQELRNPVTQASGINLINDFANAGIQYVKFGTPQNVYLMNHVCFSVMPITYVGIHLINMNTIGNIFLTLTRPFIPAAIEKILYVHSSVEELHDFFPLSMLPVQYGGILTDYYMDEWLRKANEDHDNFPAGGQKNIF